MSMARLSMPHASVLPPSTSATTIDALPVASRYTSISWHTATGEIVSITVTVAVHWSVLPLLSVTVRVTVFAPTLAHVNELMSMARLSIPHASVLPPSTSAATIEALPVASRYTSISWHTATGEIVSITVTVAVHWSVLPLLSVMVNLTVFPPTLAHVNELMSMARLSIPHASVLPPSISAATIEALPVASRYTSISWHTATGEIVSITVTVAVHWSVLPLLSVTVRVTVFAPTLAHVNELMSMARLSIPHASVLPPSTSAATIEALPVASRYTSISWHTATGEIVSITVTVAVHWSVLPLLSVTVRVTVFAPTLAHVNELMSMARLSIPHASVLPPSTSAATIEALPVASRYTSISWHTATGEIVSITVTVAAHWSLLPLLSVTVRVTVFAPTLAHVNELMSMARLSIPHASVLPPSISAATIEALPVASRYTSISWHTATGEIVSITVTVAVHWSLLPLLSVTVRVTVFAPTLAHVYELMSMARLSIPHASVLPPSISAATIEALPVASR